MLLNRRIFKLNSRVDSLSNALADLEGIGFKTDRDVHLIEKCTMQLQLEWEHFVRNFVLDCATGSFFNSTGRIYSTLPIDFRNRENACHYLIAQSPNPRNRREPEWYLPSKAIRAAMTLGLSNSSIISAELGITPWEVDNLRFVRNFIAHRSKSSALKLRSAGLSGGCDTIDTVKIIYGHSGSGVQNYLIWSSFIKGVAARISS